MVQNNHKSTGLGSLLGRIGRTTVRGLSTRVELLALEWQEERLRLRQMLIWSVAMLFLLAMAVLLITAAIIFLVPEGARVYVTAGFGLAYLCAAVGAWLGLRSRMKREPFVDSVEQFKKDRVWLESLK